MQLFIKQKAKKDNLEYAIKIIKKHEMKPKYINIEQKAHLVLNNPKQNIILYKEFLNDLTEQYNAIILELADFSLSSFTEKYYPKGMSEEMAFFFFEQIFKGVTYMHEQKGVIHRDLKLDNILLKDFKVKICDFNVVKFLDEEGDPTRVGTVDFICPELACKNLFKNGIKKEDFPGFDVYSMGVILYHLVYGKPPYQIKRNLDQGDYFEKLILETKFPDTISKEAIELMKKCICFPEKRIKLFEIGNTDWFKNEGKKFALMVRESKLKTHKDVYLEMTKSKK